MRFADILRLSLSALNQQKLRTLLTTLGVAFGSFVLIFSLSMGQGVQETITREFSRFASLRQIDVHPSFEPKASAPEDKPVAIKGTMSDEKRNRLRQESVRRERRGQGQGPRIGINAEKLQRLKEIPNVKSVEPFIDLYGRANMNGKLEHVFAHSAPADHSLLRERLSAGRFLESNDGDEAVVTEHLLYRLGVTDEKEALGKKLTLEYQVGNNKPRLLLAMFNPGRSEMAAEEQLLLDKVIKQLPAAMDQMNLSEAEKATLRKAFMPSPTAAPQQQSVTVPRELTIVGVLRSANTIDRRNGYLNWWVQDVDLVLPIGTATELFFSVPANRESGLNRVLIDADDVDHVKAISQDITGLGLQSTSLVEMIEREQFTYLLIFAIMNCVAAVALLVAGLGIINTMLMTVLERTREIGLMKAVGARNSHVWSIFLVEGALIGLVGGSLGLLCSYVASLPGDAWVRSLMATRLNMTLQDSLFTWPKWLTLGGPAFVCLVTTIAAVYPARRAAGVDPIAALRHE